MKKLLFILMLFSVAYGQNIHYPYLGQVLGNLPTRLTFAPSNSFANNVWNIDSFSLKINKSGVLAGNPVLDFNPDSNTNIAGFSWLRISQIHPSTTHPSYREYTVWSPNGGVDGDDMITLKGWNPSQLDQAGAMGWYDQWEYHYLGSYFEHHNIISHPDGTQLRLMSQTFVAGTTAATSTNLEFHKGTGFELRGFHNDNAHFSVSNSLNTGVDLTTVSTANNTNSTSVQYQVDGIANTVTEVANAGNPPYLWQQFKNYSWQIHAGSGSGKYMYLDDLAGNLYTYLQVFNDNSGTGSIIGAINNASYLTAMYTVGSAASPFGISVANSGNVYSTATAGFNVMSQVSGGKILFGIGSPPVEVGRFNASGTLVLNSKGSAGAQLNLATTAGTAPTSPVNGDIWYDGTHFQARVSGTTQQLDQQATSGSYTPGLTNTTNVTSSSANQFFWQRIGSIVHVSGSVVVTPTAPGQIALNIALPVASTLAGVTDLNGVGSGPATIYTVQGDATAHNAVLGCLTGAGINQHYISFDYIIK